MSLYCPPPPTPEDDDGHALPLFRRQLPPLLLVPFGPALVLAAQAIVTHYRHARLTQIPAFWFPVLLLHVVVVLVVVVVVVAVFIVVVIVAAATTDCARSFTLLHVCACPTAATLRSRC